MEAKYVLKKVEGKHITLTTGDIPVRAREFGIKGVFLTNSRLFKNDLLRTPFFSRTHSTFVHEATGFQFGGAIKNTVINERLQEIGEWLSTLDWTVDSKTMTSVDNPKRKEYQEVIAKLGTLVDRSK